jgi:hypothetical protein
MHSLAQVQPWRGTWTTKYGVKCDNIGLGLELNGVLLRIRIEKTCVRLRREFAGYDEQLLANRAVHSIMLIGMFVAQKVEM